jgi:hypothetical protein
MVQKLATLSPFAVDIHVLELQNPRIQLRFVSFCSTEKESRDRSHDFALSAYLNQA